MFTIKSAASPVLYVITGIEEIDGEIFVTGSACNGIFTCRVHLDDMEEMGVGIGHIER
jgi:hypothetical protein